MEVASQPFFPTYCDVLEAVQKGLLHFLFFTMVEINLINKVFYILPSVQGNYIYIKVIFTHTLTLTLHYRKIELVR